MPTKEEDSVRWDNEAYKHLLQEKRHLAENSRNTIFYSRIVIKPNKRCALSWASCIMAFQNIKKVSLLRLEFVNSARVKH